MEGPLSFGFDIAKDRSHPLWRRENLAICVPKKVSIVLTQSAAIKFHLPRTLVYQIIDIFGGCRLITGFFSLFLFNKDKFR